MRRNRPFFPNAVALVVPFLMLVPGWGTAQTQQLRSAPRTSQASPATVNDEDREATRERLISLLRLSPKLTAVLSRDPSLLSDQEYVSRNNPDLAQFLQQHPEIARNPEYYLYARIGGTGNPGLRLEQYVWPETNYNRAYVWERYVSHVMGFLVFIVILAALLWLLRLVLENRRWNRIVKLQSDVHGKLLDKFSNHQELLTYMNTEAGKRFLEAAPMAVGFELTAPAKMSLARVLMPLQLGVVLTLMGIGFLWLRNNIPAEIQTPALIFGTLGLTLGIGFIISAGLAYFLARHLDLLPQKSTELAAKGQS
jgi:hypothetical protein